MAKERTHSKQIFTGLHKQDTISDLKSNNSRKEIYGFVSDSNVDI